MCFPQAEKAEQMTIRGGKLFMVLKGTLEKVPESFHELGSWGDLLRQASTGGESPQELKDFFVIL